MNINATGNLMEMAAEPFLPETDFVSDYSWVLTQPQIRKSLWSDPQAVKSLEKTAESLVFAYLVANLNFKNTPLKEFMDGFEKKILLACLRLTRGSQREAAAVLGVKPTALFEKMRKHAISGRRHKLSARLEAKQPGAVQ